ncbi:MAG TPA: LD-carboxypeptidase [Candidatus Binataceae bacterium]|nr:LD-carboxypeptidase [Candidatus Binataceae bacterium]
MPSAPVKPPALHPGDTVGVVAPAAAIDREYLERGVGALGAMGFRVKVSSRALARSGILAGDDRERAAELQDYFADDSVRAIFAARGGYGCGRLLPMLDFARIARTPKPFIGFSDETFLLNPLVTHAGIVAIHGPMIAMDFARGLSARSFRHLRALLTGELSSFELEARECVHPGRAEGELMGGCLSVIVAMLATPFAPDFRGRILFLEDTGERAYRIDRMLVQLRQSGVLAAVSGIVFGAIRPVEGNADEAKLISRFIAEQTASLGIPVIAGIEAGHGTENLALPFGVRALLDADAGTLAILEPAVAL